MLKNAAAVVRKENVCVFVEFSVPRLSVSLSCALLVLPVLSCFQNRIVLVLLLKCRKVVVNFEERALVVFGAQYFFG